MSDKIIKKQDGQLVIITHIEWHKTIKKFNGLYDKLVLYFTGILKDILSYYDTINQRNEPMCVKWVFEECLKKYYYNDITRHGFCDYIIKHTTILHKECKLVIDVELIDEIFDFIENILYHDNDDCKYPSHEVFDKIYHELSIDNKITLLKYKYSK